MLTALIPGSFDPFTLGHLDLVRRAYALSDRVIVAVAHNPHKSARIPFDARCEAIRETLAREGLADRASVDTLPGGLLVEGAKKLGATHLVKGIRNAQDLAYEEPMARANMDLGGLDTLFLLTDPALAHISSSLVREIYSLGGDASRYLPDASTRALTAAYTTPAADSKEHS
ncbi:MULTISPECIES: pantetheine-phosphate adenylyltransferase [Dermabacter]|uniref:pantetheine-phosphate adenylyltransferase n=1 Tax=Dermabacter TaxID=36739 RepID=UPI0008A37F8A|nr:MULTISPECIES: pantetheine-phosphate adenylyltransferase [unclassified Dermabacter]MCT1708487.1 pantetheine-phosphate adenylyltransferase [Dermabacter hominis]MDU4922694.1 pantetheine-phosphate adenylyltransferase [Dermabacter sp.]OFT20784.1 pantetheine-phosphate adenylyltransferase [Dermabacter sp. HMSC08H10]